MTSNERDAVVIVDCFVRAMALVGMYSNATLQHVLKWTDAEMGRMSTDERAVIQAFRNFVQFSMDN